MQFIWGAGHMLYAFRNTLGHVRGSCDLAGLTSTISRIGLGIPQGYLVIVRPERIKLYSLGSWTEMSWHGWAGLEQLSQTSPDQSLVWHGLAWPGLVRSGPVWSGLVWSAPVRSGSFGVPNNSQKIPQKIPRNSQKIPKKFPRNSQEIPKKIPKNPQKIPKNSQKIPKKIPKKSQKSPKTIFVTVSPYFF